MKNTAWLFLVFALMVCFAFTPLQNEEENGSSASQGIRFTESTFDEALAVAKEKNTLVFIDVYADWCGPCKALSKRVFVDEEVGDLFNESFINFKMNSDKKEYRSYMEEYHIRSLPTLLFVDPSGEVVHRSIGLIDKDELLAFAERAKRKFDKKH